MKNYARAAASALLALAATSGDAADFFVSATYDLSNLSNHQTGFSLVFEQAENPAISLQEHDWVEFTLDFLGDQTLIIHDPYHLSAELVPSNLHYNFRASGGWEFYNPSSNLAPVSIVDEFGPYATEGFGAFAVYNRQIIGPGPIEFSGLKIQLEVMDLLPNGSFTHDASRFRFEGSSFEVGRIPGVPESSAWMMMIIGFGTVGATMRRARRRAAPATA
jgi:hypothetical protein